MYYVCTNMIKRLDVRSPPPKNVERYILECVAVKKTLNLDPLYTLASRGLEEPPTLRVGWRNPKKKSSSRLSGGCVNVITTRKKKVLVVCLVGARSLLRPEKIKILVVGGCAIVITTGKKKI